MTTQTAVAPSVEGRLAGVEARLTALGTILVTFVEEQREWRNQFVEEQREHRREVSARFDKMEENQREHRREISARFDKMEENQREQNREVNARLVTVETRTDRVADRVTNLMLAVLGIVGTLSIAVIVASIFS